MHESSHLRLYLEQVEDEIVLNSDEARYPAPFRQDKRPMTGIYHAFYVLAHVCCCFLDLKQHKEKFVDCGDFDAIFDRAYARFTESSAIVKKYGQLTERGKSIFEQMNQEVQQRLNH